MEHHYSIKTQGNYNLGSYFDLDDDEGPEEYFSIQNFIISPNSQLIAIIVTRSEIAATCYNLYEYMIEVFDIRKNAKILDGEWLDSDSTYKVFCQISYDSKYLVHHSKKTLCIIDLVSFKQKNFDKIGYVYTLDDQNQIFVLKKEYIQIYSIQNNKFKKIFSYESQFTWLAKISSNLFVILQEEKIKFLFLQQELAKDLSQFNILKYYCEQNKAFIMKNILIIILFSSEEQNYIQLKDLRNGKLLRNVISDINDQRNFVQENKNFYVSEIKIIKKNQIFYQFNLILGLANQMVLQIPNIQNETYITSHIAVDIDEDREVLRYYVFERK